MIKEPLRQLLSGHSVSTAYEMGWSELANGDLLDAAEADFDAMHRLIVLLVKFDLGDGLNGFGWQGHHLCFPKELAPERDLSVVHAKAVPGVFAAACGVEQAEADGPEDPEKAE